MYKVTVPNEVTSKITSNPSLFTQGTHKVLILTLWSMYEKQKNV